MGFWADHIRRNVECAECFLESHIKRHCEHPEVIVAGDGRPYLRRYTLIHQDSLRVYLHEILLSDEDRHMHDHPWDFTTILLSGGYIEERPVEPQRFTKQSDGGYKMETVRIKWPRFSRIKHRAEDFHRIELPEGKPVWTLFFAGDKRRDWGFMTEDGWVHYRKYLNDKFGPSSIEMEMAKAEMGD